MNRIESAPRLFGAAEVCLGRQRSPQHEAGPNMLPYLRAANVKDGALDLADVKLMNFEPSEQKTFALRAGDILITEGSGSLAAVGASAVWNDELPGTICFQNTLVRLRPRPGISDGRYLGWWARAAYASGEFASIASGANIYHISAERVKSLSAPLPRLDEQRRIADFLDAEAARIDDISAARRASRSLIDEKASCSIAMLSTRGVGPTKETGSVWIPVTGADWEIVPLKRRWRIIDCKHRTPTYVDSGYPVISPGDVSPGRLDISVAHRFVDENDYVDLADHLRRARRGDIVYGRNASVGVAAYVDTDERFTMGQDVCRITSDTQDQLFLSHFLNTTALAQLASLQIGSTFSRINIGTLLELSVACPPPEEQRKLAAAMDLIAVNAKSAVVSVNRQLALLAERRQALITAAVAGQIDVTTARGVDV